MKRLVLTTLSALLFSAFSAAQTVTVTGNAFLQGETDHSTVRVVFTRTAPSAWTDSAFTDAAGAFSKAVEQGVYTIGYAKEGFLPITRTNTAVYADLTLPDTTLETAGLSGNLSGVLAAGTYKVSGNITVAGTDTLHIMPGVRLEFKSALRLTVQGRLEAVGTAADSIVFTAYDTTRRWDGIWFSGTASNGSHLSYALVQFSQASGIRLENSSASLTHLLVRKNTMSHGLEGAYYGGAGIYVGGGSPTLDHLVITDNASGYNGGGLCLMTGTAQQVSNTVLQRNTSADHGPGIYCSDGGLRLTNVVLSQNTGGAGAGIYVSRARQDLTITNVLICDNSGGGGSIHLENPNAPVAVRISNMTLVGEKSTHGIYLSGTFGSLSIHNSILANNRLAGLYFTNGSTPADVRNSCFYGNPSGNIVNGPAFLGTNVTVNARGDSCDPWSNIKLRPMFTDSANADYRPALGSPCINAGMADSLMLPTDLDGNTRPVGWAADMGPYELQTVVSDSVHGTHQQYSLAGSVHLEGETDHSTVRVVFTRTAPSAWTDSAFTDAAGAFSKAVEQGVYTIGYAKEGFLPITRTNTAVYADLTLPDTTLETAGLSGNLSGVLAAGTYKVSGNITVAGTDTLHIMPGVRLEFKSALRLTVQGRLEAVGTAADSIVFTAYDTTRRWDGIWFSGTASNGSHLSYALVQFSQASGIRLENSSASLTHLLVRKNTMSHGLEGAYYGGAGIYVGGGSPTLDHLVITDNASGYNGGGLCLMTGTAQQVSNTVLQRNTSADHGPGIYCSDGGLRLTNVVLSQNTGGAGAGIYVSRARQDLTITNVLICDNSGGGGSIHLENPNAPVAVRISNMTLVGEKSTHGIYLSGTFGSLSIHNSILANNRLAGLYFTNGSTPADVRNSCFYGNPSGNIVNGPAFLGTNVTVNARGDSCDPWSNIKLRPMFTDSANADYRPALGSPCINAGMADSLMLPTDLDGNTRPVGWAADMGPYELQTVVSDSVHGTHQQYSLAGSVHLEGETDHSTVRVVFTRTAPSAWTDSAFTDAAGAFSKAVEQGVYTIGYAKEGFLPITRTNTAVYADLTLPDTTLETAGLSGNLSGVLAAGTYKVSGNITVAGTDTLHIMPGVRLEFKSALRLTVQGRLEAVGTAADSIVFTAYDTTRRWDGIWFSGTASNGSHLSYALVQFSQASGIRLENSSASLTHLLVRKNTMSHGLEGAYYGGAGIYVGGGSPTLDHLVITDNASGYNGGGLCLMTGTAQQVSNTVLQRNTSADHGPGIYCSDGGLRLTNVVLSQNTGGAGAGIYVSRARQDLTITNVLICDNSGGGGSIHLENPNAPVAVRISNMTLVGEKSTHGIYLSGTFGSLSIHNSILANNRLAGLYFTNGSTPADVRNSCFYGNPSGNIVNGPAFLGTNVTVNARGDSCDTWGNIQLPVRFKDSVNVNCHLALGSPCINAGMADSLMLPTDLDGNTRPVGWAADMGCYEAQSVLSLSSGLLDFGSTRMGHSKDSPFTLTNTGDESIAIRSITASSGIFSATPDSLSIPSLSSAADTLRFTPTTPGDTAGYIVIVSNDPASPDTIAVAGFGASYIMTLSRRDVEFGTVRVGQSVDSVITITNKGNSILVVDSIKSNNPSIMCAPASLTIPVGASATDTLRFSPSAGDSLSGHVVFAGNGFSSPDTITVVGYGATYGCTFSVRSIQLGTVRIGLSRDTVITLTNTGNQPIQISGITSSTPGFVASPSQFTIPVGAAVQDTLRFTPVSEGELTAQIIFKHDSTWADTITVMANGTLTGVLAGMGIPEVYSLSQNYPNPFNPSTTIRYGLPQRSMVLLAVYNSIGQKVATLVDQEQEAAYHEVRFDAARLASGIYFYRIHARRADGEQGGDFVQVCKFILMK